ncbi:hypothetical protein [Nonomuraea turcica]|uniref:hypothetical protein n=1 Tax=Nonomuraea sp. G32 TaxID=3067274 RepID=UPI00273C086F|nr:hypothetical protein [Nonomuraea sp. G32]MDP4501128.1 hypothetical protein [Nonomuraea sp. G32]
MMAQPTIAVPVDDLQALITLATRVSMAAADLLIDAGHAPAPGLPSPTLSANVVSLDERRACRAHLAAVAR